MPSIMRNNIRYGSSIGGGNGDIVELTQEQYDALGDSVLTDNKTYYITDADDQYNASSVIFDNTDTNLNAGTVQEAIVEQNKNFENRIGFPNYSRVLNNTSLKSPGGSYTATENCWVIGHVYSSNGSTASSDVYVDGVLIYTHHSTDQHAYIGCIFPVKKGSVVTTKNVGTYVLTVYAMT